MTIGTLGAYLEGRASRTRVAIDIEGLPYFFSDGPIAASSRPSPLSLKTEIVCIAPRSVEIGEFDLDEDARRVSSATASFTLLKDSAGILASLITPRARPIGWVTSSVAAGDLFIPTNIASRTVSSTPFYIGGETVVCTNWSSSVMTITRGRFGSTAQPQYGDGTGIGVEIYASPRAWVNRRCKIYLFAVGDNGQTMTSTQSAIIYDGELSEAPSYSRGGWDFNLEHVSERVNNAQCNWGQREIVIDKQLQDDSLLSRFYLADIDRVLFDSYSSRSRVLVKSDFGNALCEITADGANYIDTRPKFAEVVTDPSIGVDNIRGFRSNNAEKIRHVVKVKGNAAREAARLLGSTTLTLPSLARSEYGGAQWRFSAGLGNYINDSNFKALAKYCPQWDTLLTETMTGGEILKELMIAARAYWFVDEVTGKIDFMPMSARSFDAAPSTTITKADVIGEPETYITQGPALHSVKMGLGHDPLSDKYLATVESNDAEIAAEFEDTAARSTISCKFLAVDVGDFLPREQRIGTLARSQGMSYVDVVSMLRRIQRDSLVSRVKHAIKLPLKWMSVRIGATIGYVDDRALAGDGTTASGPHYVVGKSVDVYAGTVTLKLLALRSGWVFAPGALITAYNSGTRTATLDTTISGVASPGSLFPAGADVYAHNCSTGTTDFLSVSSSTTTTVTFTTAMSAYTSNAVILYFDGSATLPSGRTRANMLNQVPTSGSTIGDEYNTEWG